MLKKLQKVSLLYDIYGALLTEKQKDALELYYFDNHSLAEIAERYKTSRQAVFDLLKRAVKYLEDMEESMKLYKRFSYRKELLTEALDMINSLDSEVAFKENKKRLIAIIEELLQENEA